MIRTIFINPADAAAMKKERVVVIDEQLSPEELAQANVLRERYECNLGWLEAHGREVYAQHRGRHICVAGEELFVADTAEEVLALAKAAHAEDDGRLLWYIHPVKGPRIYGHTPPMIVLPDFPAEPTVISFDPPECHSPSFRLH